jgi:hypothetical protein
MRMCSIGGPGARSSGNRLAMGRGTLGEAGRAEAHTAVRESRVLEPCQGARVGAAVGRAGQVVETVRALVWPR